LILPIMVGQLPFIWLVKFLIQRLAKLYNNILHKSGKMQTRWDKVKGHLAKINNKTQTCSKMKKKKVHFKSELKRRSQKI